MVLITGIGGFIGQDVAEYFTENGVDVIGVYHKKSPDCTVRRIISCDLAHDEIEQYLEGEVIDAIIHFAGQIGGDKVRDYLDNTIGSTRKLIDYAEKAKVKTFIYISSISVYGETLSQVDETSDRINLDDYGMTKYLCERMLQDSKIERRIVIRLSKTLGKRCDFTGPSWLNKATIQILNQENVYYTNPDLMFNNMLYVDDLSSFLLILLDTNITGFELFVLGAKDRKRIIDILNKLKQSLSSESKLIEKQAQGRNKCYAIDITHAQEYGFQPRSIDEIIEKFAEDIIDVIQ